MIQKQELSTQRQTHSVNVCSAVQIVHGTLAWSAVQQNCWIDPMIMAQVLGGKLFDIAVLTRLPQLADPSAGIIAFFALCGCSRDHRGDPSGRNHERL
jgi:hypothetical protein